MTSPRWWLLLLTLAGPGCAAGLPARLPEPELLEPCRALPQCCRSNVHIFLINTIDPFDAADLCGVRAFLIDLGFIKTSAGQLYHAGRFADDIRKLHATDPEARFVLVGFDRGAAAAQTQAEALVAEGVPVSLVVYLDGTFLPDRPPPPGTHVLNVHNASGFCDVSALSQIENITIPDGGHFGIPTHPVTLELLARELGLIAETVPVRPLLTPAGLVPGESAPRPRPVPSDEREGPGNYLKPASTLPHPDSTPAVNVPYSVSSPAGTSEAQNSDVTE